MKKIIIKLLAAGLVTSSVFVSLPKSAFAAETTLSNPVLRNRPTYPFDEISVGYGDFYGTNKITKDNLTEKAKSLYLANETEGKEVVEIINHANYFAEKFYASDGKLRGKREAYKNAYIGLAIKYYLQNESEKWLEALYNLNTFEDSIDYTNMNFARVDFSTKTIYNESMIVHYANSLVEQGLLCVSGVNQYEYSRTTVGDRKLNLSQTDISSKNYAFVIGANSDYIDAYNTFKQYYIYGSRFNAENDATIKAAYGALLYLRSIQTNLDEVDVKQWINNQFNLDGYNPSKLEYSYIENVLKGFEEAKARKITTVDEANKVAKDLLTNRSLIHVNEDYNFSYL